MPLNSLEPRMAKASLDHRRLDPAATLFFDTLAAIAMSEKEAAYTMAIDPAQLSRVKSGQARLPLDAVWRLPDLFWNEFRRRVDQAKALSDAQCEHDFAELVGRLVTAVLQHRIVRRERGVA
jgi:hypothetical protein